MSKEQNEISDEKGSSIKRPREAAQVDPLDSTTDLLSQEVPPGVHRRDS